MSMFDSAKEKLGGLVDDHGDKVSEGLDKAGDFADEKTGGKYGDQIDQGVDKAKDGLDGLDGQNDDIDDGNQ
ncbi:MAG TPA: antitoxin [Kribbella sp.]|uniref:antitoxin n=1 Tax=Kribbella sp. TaxID=1871183 RepID=UPI002D76CB94|nr:antitoxin [Kribbella sp.]HET6293629.1 antitoxin [Kribbella sp.]